MKLNDAYIKVEYRLEREGFDNVPALIRYYVGNRKPVSHVGLVVFRHVFFIKNSVKSVFCFLNWTGRVCPTTLQGWPPPSENVSLESLSKKDMRQKYKHLWNQSTLLQPSYMLKLKKINK